LPEIRNRCTNTLFSDVAPNSTADASRCSRAITRCCTVGNCHVVVSSSPNNSKSSRWVKSSKDRSRSSAAAARYSATVAVTRAELILEH